jgi:hypothetical protein
MRVTFLLAVACAVLAACSATAPRPASVTASPPAGPVVAQPVSVGPTSIELTWTAPDTDREVTGYELQWHPVADTTWPEDVHQIAAEVTSYTLTGLEPATEYGVRLRAVFGQVKSVWVERVEPTDAAQQSAPESGTDSGTEAGSEGGTEAGSEGGTEAGTDSGTEEAGTNNETETRPPAPTGFAATNQGSALTVTWAAPETSFVITGYEIGWRRPAEEASWRTRNNIVQTSSSYTIFRLDPESTYQVRLRALAGPVKGRWAELSAVTGLPGVNVGGLPEGREEWGNVLFIVYPGSSHARNLRVNINVSETGDMVAPGDLGSRVVRVDGRNVLVSVNLIDDTVDDADSDITVEILPGTGYVVGFNGSDVKTVKDDD